jgi:tetratricopeptide (TPR) repeat protein
MTQSEVQRIRALLQGGRFADALAAAAALEPHMPADRDVLFMMAVCHRSMNRPTEALAALERLARHHPRFSRLHQERGHCHLALKDAPRAIEAYERAEALNPALPASWKSLQELYRCAGEAARTALAASRVAALESMAPEIRNATALMADGDLAPAERLLRTFLGKHGDHVEALHLLARIALENGMDADAERLLERVLELAPGSDAARCDYARALIGRQQYAQGCVQLERLLASEPGDVRCRRLYAAACMGAGRVEKAAALYRRLLADAPRDADLHLALGHASRILGRLDEATMAYREAVAARPESGAAYFSLANLKVYRFPRADLERMQALEASPAAASVDRYHLCFALGRAFEDLREYQRSYGFYERGNRLRKSAGRYRPERIELNTRLQMEICTREFFAARAGFGAADRDPIFIVGLPRSGSTLVEQILASHPSVEATWELADIQRMVQALIGADPDPKNPRYPRALEAMSGARARQLGEKYLADTRAYRGGMPFFVDKMPNNFQHIGLIHLILPNARVLDVRRAPMACCFSIFKQLFARGQEFAYDLADIARYYRTYLDLMRHWNVALPGKVLRVQYEDLVGDLEGGVRRILGFCGLEYQPACLEFHRTARRVHTPSSEQVRRPIFRDGIDEWRHYEPWLGELQAALGDALLRYAE